MGIGGRIRDWVNDQTEEWGERLGIFLGNVFGRGARSSYDEIPDDLKKAIYLAYKTILELELSPSLEKMLQGEPGSLNLEYQERPIPEEVLLRIGNVVQMPFMLLGALLGQPVGLLPFMTWMNEGGFAPLFQQSAQELFRPTRFGPADGVQAVLRGDFDQGDLVRDLEYGGWGDEHIKSILNMYRPLLTPEIVRQLTWRLPEQKDQFRAELTKAGYTEEKIAALEELYTVIPPVQDIITMAVREVFTPEIAEAFGQFEDFPEKFAELAAKLGISPEVAKWYWGMHWGLPSAGQGFEMFHRTTLEPTEFSGNPIGHDNGRPYYNVIDRDRLNVLLRALDVMPAWRDKLTRIAYTPLTRVDVRRMNALGILGPEGVKRAYLDHGYSPEHADLMTEFTLQYNATQARELTKTEVLKALRKGTIDRTVAGEYLQDLGYTEDDAEFILDSEEYAAAEADRQLSESKIKTLYLTGLMPKLEATDELAKQGYDAREIEYLYSLWDLEAEPAVKLPTRSELFHFLTLDIITEDEFTTWMRNIGYPDQHVNWYVQEHAADELEAAQKAEAAARDLADKIAKAEAKTAYEQERAQIDVNIATARTYIAEQRLVLLQATEDAAKASIKERIAEANIYIAGLNQEKAELRLT